MQRRKTDEQDSTISIYGNYLMALLVTAAVFVVEILWNRGWLDGALLGVLISKIFDGVSKQNEYFFPTRRSTTHTEKEKDDEKSY